MNENKINEKEMIWIDITPKHGIWKPETPGDTITGKLLTTIHAPYKGRPNTKYCLQTDHPEAINQKIIIYGTHCLNKTLQDPELIGKTIKITYKGQTPTSDPLKKPFKKYKIQIQLHPKTPYTPNTQQQPTQHQTAEHIKTNRRHQHPKNNTTIHRNPPSRTPQQKTQPKRHTKTRHKPTPTSHHHN